VTERRWEIYIRNPASSTRAKGRDAVSTLTHLLFILVCFRYLLLWENFNFRRDLFSKFFRNPENIKLNRKPLSCRQLIWAESNRGPKLILLDTQFWNHCSIIYFTIVPRIQRFLESEGAIEVMVPVSYSMAGAGKGLPQLFLPPGETKLAQDLCNRDDREELFRLRYYRPKLTLVNQQFELEQICR